MAGTMMEITLERDGHDQPWGFRLQGGVDVGMPLSVQRVLVGTPSEGILKKSDVICKVSSTDARNLTHQAAADLFNNAGNQISIIIKRPPSASGASKTSVLNGPQVVPPPAPVPVKTPPVSGGVPLPGIASPPATTSPRVTSNVREVAPLPKTNFVLKSQLSSMLRAPTAAEMDAMAIHSQPYRTQPLIQPSAKGIPEMGVGSQQHLRMQEHHLSGEKEPQFMPVSASQLAAQKASEFQMKQKVTGTLQNIQQGFQQNQLSSSTHFVQHQTITSSESIISTQHSQTTPLLDGTQQLDEAESPTPPLAQSTFKRPAGEESVSPTGLVHPDSLNMAALPSSTFAAAPSSGSFRKLSPSKPPQVILTPTKEYNPQDSATWRALQETDAPMDPEKVKNYTSLREHDPVYAEIYTTAKIVQNANRSPSPRPSTPVRSPVAEFLPSSFKVKHELPEENAPSQSHLQHSAVRAAAIAGEPTTSCTHSTVPRNEVDSLPIYETNSIGGRKRIAQSATFNKVMMEVLGE